MLADAQPKQEADERRFGRSASWLAYTYPGDLAEIVLRRRDTFSVVFQGGDKQFWKARLDAIATYRTPMAHNRAEVLGVNERLQCRMYAEQVLRAISAHNASVMSACWPVAVLQEVVLQLRTSLPSWCPVRGLPTAL